MQGITYGTYHHVIHVAAVCSFIWLFADLCWLWCVPWLSVATRIPNLFCQSWQLPLCRSTGCPARLWKAWLSSHYSSTPPCTAHGFPATIHPKKKPLAFQPPLSNDVTTLAVQPPPTTQWLSSHHSAKTPLCDNSGCPATTKKNNDFPATIQLKHHCVTILAVQPPLQANGFPATNCKTHYRCWPAFFILCLLLLLPSLGPRFLSRPDGKQIEIYWAAWMEASMQGCFWHHQRHETFPSICPAPSGCQVSTLWGVMCKQVMLLDSGKHAFALLHAVFG